MATYVISATGNNANPGTEASPKALSYLSSLNPGDIAELRGDTYVEQIVLNKLRGTVAQPITIRGYNGETPILDGEWNKAVHPLVTPGTLNLYEFDALVKINNCRYINISDIRCIRSDGRAFSIGSCVNMNFDNLSAEDIYGMSFNCIGAGPGTPTNKNITLTNSDFYNVCIAHNWFQQTINGTYIATIPSSIFFGRGTDGVYVQKCTLERAGAEGFVMARGSRNIVFEDLIAVDCRHNCYYIATTQYSTMNRCVGYFTAQGGAAIPQIRGQGLVLRDEETSYTQGYDDYKSTNNTVTNCIFIDGQLGYTGYGQASMQYFTFRNNTVVNCLQNILNRGTNPDRPTPVGNIYENNIFLNTQPYTNNIFWDAEESTGNQVNTSAGATYNNNAWYDVNGSARPANAAGANDIVDTDPQLLDPDYALDGVRATQFRALNIGLKYGPKTGSPVINAGSSTATTGDYFNRAAEDARDIGAVEYTTAGIPSDPGGNDGGGGTGGGGSGGGGGGGGTALPTVYVTPKTWSPGDAPDATEANKYKQALDSIHLIAGDVEKWAPVAALKIGEDNNHFMRHIHRWLWYTGSGTLEDADAANETITLSANADGSPARYDLSTVSWLALGKLYYVSDCTWIMETPDP